MFKPQNNIDTTASKNISKLLLKVLTQNRHYIITKNDAKKIIQCARGKNYPNNPLYLEDITFPLPFNKIIEEKFFVIAHKIYDKGTY